MQRLHHACAKISLIVKSHENGRAGRIVHFLHCVGFDLLQRGRWFFRTLCHRALGQRAETVHIAGRAGVIVAISGQPVGSSALLGALFVHVLTVILHYLPSAARPAGRVSGRDLGRRGHGRGPSADGQLFAAHNLGKAGTGKRAGAQIESVHGSAQGILLFKQAARGKRSRGY